ncbi:MAG: ATP-binding cassette domain-containing protein [Alphaproteobacteria bacterium]|nr:ATP-binding cassette domain-containing protein [Alphaproteobacteria bacterium]
MPESLDTQTVSDGLLAGARHVDVRVGRHEILSSVDLAVHEGEIVTVIGPNGSGKTTLLRVLLGLVPTTAGEVWRRPGLRIGYMPQRLAVDPALPLSVARFLGLGGAPGRDAIEAALTEVGAAHAIDSPMQGISGGELQRVILARALLRLPDLLVLDEPVQSVDVTGQKELHDLITRIRERRRCGVVMVSHDLHLVMASTDTVVCINHHVCCTGRPETVSRDPAYLELFGPEVAKGFAVYTHHHDHAHDAAGAVVADRQAERVSDDR